MILSETQNELIFLVKQMKRAYNKTKNATVQCFVYPDNERVVLIEKGGVQYDCVTRNTADFAESKIPAIEPEEFLKRIS